MLLASELTAWGSRRTAQRWLGTVSNARQAESSARPGSEELTRAVADGLFKLTAYKDEYEVARLMLDADGLGEARSVAGGRGKMSWRLHPPILRAMGLKTKISIGSWARPGIRVLAAGKRVRGTILDPFRWAKVRRVERRLPGEFIDVLDRALSLMTSDTYSHVVAIAGLPDMVRGYEHIKLDNVERYRQALAAAQVGA